MSRNKSNGYSRQILTNSLSTHIHVPKNSDYSQKPSVSKVSRRHLSLSKRKDARKHYTIRKINEIHAKPLMISTDVGVRNLKKQTIKTNQIKPTESDDQASSQRMNNPVEKNIWSKRMERILSYHFPGITINNERKKRGRTRLKHANYIRCCSPCCLVLSVLGTLLLLTALAALLVEVIDGKKETATGVSTTVTTVTTVTTTTSTSTTTTPLQCGQSCLNQSWIDSSGGLALWPFNDSFIDIVGGHNGFSSLYLPTFVTGYLDQAVLFNATANQSIYTSFIPLYHSSFTVQAWIKPTGYPNPNDHSIVGLCPLQVPESCLHINIRNTKLYFGFYYDDLGGLTTILLNQWINVAFVFDATILLKTIYLNGFVDNQGYATSALNATSGNFTIGTNTLINFPNNFFQGYIDQLSINQRPKSSCEILEIATLAAYFKFDTPSPYTDSGPNSVSTTSSTTSIITGYNNQAISFSGSSTSYFQTWGFTSLGITNQPFSITFWIQPQILSGTILHLSTSSLGTGSTCFPLLGFTSNGSIVAQVLTSSNTVATAVGPVLPLSSSWSLVVQTWSSTNGLQLYVDYSLVNSVTASTFLGSGTTPNYLTLGSCLSGCGGCVSGSIGTPGSFTGAIDDFRIYSRELTSDDVCTLYLAA